MVKHLGLSTFTAMTCVQSLIWELRSHKPCVIKSNQSILQEISPGISLEGVMLKLKLQYFYHLMRRVDSLEKTDFGRDWVQEEKGMTEDEMAGWHHWFDGPEFEWTRELVMDREAWRAAIHGVAKSQTRLSDWTELSNRPFNPHSLLHLYTCKVLEWK